MKWPTWASALLLAMMMTGLNVAKPIHIDDWTYYTFAREFAAHPARPYDFLYGSPFAVPANLTLAPPVLPAWLALGMSLLNDNPVVLKLWLFPFAWLLAWAMSALLRWFAPAVAEPVLWLTMLSPGILTSFNLMLEVPVLSVRLAIEVAWYFVITPFPTARRVLGIITVLTLLFARLAGDTCALWPRRGWVWGSAVGSAALGILFFVVDWHDARAPHLAATVAAHGQYQPAAGGTAWFADLGGFAYTCQRNGLKQFAFGRSIPRRGDVIFVPTTPYPVHEIMKSEKDVHLQNIGVISVSDALPLRTVLNFYAGSAPLRHRESPRYVVAVYRVVEDFTAGATSR